MTTTQFRMLPEHAIEAGIARARSIAVLHSDELGNPRVDHPEVLAALVLWDQVRQDLQAERDAELAARPPVILTKQQQFEDVYGEGSFPITRAAKSGRTYEVYAQDQWVKVYWRTHGAHPSWTTLEGESIPQSEIEAARDA